MEGLRSGARRVRHSLDRDEGSTVLEGCLIIPQVKIHNQKKRGDFISMRVTLLTPGGL